MAGPCRRQQRIEIPLTKSQARSGCSPEPATVTSKTPLTTVAGIFIGQGQRQCGLRQRASRRAGHGEIIAQPFVGHGALARQRQQRVVGGAVGRGADQMGDGIAGRSQR